MILVVGKQKDGKIHLIEDEFRKYMHDAYNEGYTRGKSEEQMKYLNTASDFCPCNKLRCEKVATAKLSNNSITTSAYSSGGIK